MSLIPTQDECFRAAVADLLELPELHSSRQRVHHFDLSEYDHLMQVAQTAHRVSRFLRADQRISARAGLLHDLGAHWFDTLAPCELAARLAEPHGVCHAIRAHTLFPVLPRTREAWAVVAADLITSARECHFVFGRESRRARTRMAQRMRQRMATPARVLPPLVQAARRRRLAMRRVPLSAFPGLDAGPFVRRAPAGAAAPAPDTARHGAWGAGAPARALALS